MALNYENQNYGNLRIINPHDQAAVSPPGVVVITKTASQNHAMMKAAYVGQATAKDFNDAACVEGSQTGYIVSGEHVTRMLPMHLRSSALALTGVSDYSKMYNHIGSFGQHLSVQTGNYLHPYFDKYDSELNQFIAHFERPPKTIGVVVLINGEIIAIDKFPSFSYAAQVWDVLIRDCYGSVALEAMLKDWHPPDMVNILTASDSTFDEAEPEGALLDLVQTIKMTTGQVVGNELQSLMETEFTAKPEDDSPASSSYLLKGDGYVGQVITSSDFHYMVNISIDSVDFSPASTAARQRYIEERLMASQQGPFEVP
jgi:hypothetical protein